MKKLLMLAVLSACVVFGGVSRVSAAVNDFRITNYDIAYSLDRDGTGHSQLHTVETITAAFPAYDQNHGIERAIPKSYDGHSTNLTIASVQNAKGANLHYTTYESNGNEVIRIGDADRYVHGSQTYHIAYNQQDTTRYFANTNDDEFYWDTNGVGWAVPIDTLHVSVAVGPNTQRYQTNKASCYQGGFGDTQACGVTSTSPGHYEVTATNLQPYQNATIALGFKPHSFAAYAPTFIEKWGPVWAASQFIAIPIALLLAVALWVIYKRISDRKGEHTTIVPEYVPPAEASVTAAAEMYPKAKAVFTAQLLDLAVRGYLKIYETSARSWFRRAKYDIEIIRDISDLKAEEQEVLSDIFSSTSVGQRLSMESLKNNTSIALQLSDNPKKLRRNIRGTYGLRARVADKTKLFRKISLVFLVSSVLLLSIPLFVLAIGIFIASFQLYPLTDKGLALYHYLEGFKMYITTAETDRIRMLQAPETAQKIGEVVNTNNPAQLVKLYEKALPYAVLFGVEKDWNQQLGRYYESLGTSPGWYAGNNGLFNAAVFSSSMSSFTSSTSYVSSTSTNSGGSGGGGFSGGGGGGGGGGGW